MGKAVEPFRKEIVLATKFHLPEEQAPRDAVLEQEVHRHLEASMKNLHTDYVDLYSLHWGNELVPVEEIADVMGKLIKAGLIRGWEMSQVSADIIDKAHRVTPLAAVQSLYNVMERDCQQATFGKNWETKKTTIVRSVSQQLCEKGTASDTVPFSHLYPDLGVSFCFAPRNRSAPEKVAHQPP